MIRMMGALGVAVLLAAVSFAYARHQYVQKNSATIVNPFNKNESATIKNPLADEKLFGDWMKDEWIFAIAVPSALVAGGLVLAFKK
ncbi:MAG: hypothetical protein EXS18_01875 [Verrucomicrobiae bacterium]|nr:hypothetical protein [Verrucomicrobiae bacterium]